VDRLKLFKPRPTISDRELTVGLRWLTLEGTVSPGFNSITPSGFLAAFALALGANNLQIGILADFFSVRQLNLTFTWTDPSTFIQLPALSIIGYDFLFGIAFIIGVITLGTRQINLAIRIYKLTQGGKENGQNNQVSRRKEIGRGISGEAILVP
jgi:hypothetical protein